jgi:hypothetical protein
MAHAHHLFKNLRLNKNNGQVGGITSGLDIVGQGTFKFNITNDDGKARMIEIPNSLYIPNLKKCLLSPQHWVQEAGDEQIWMRNYRNECVLNWRESKENNSFPADDQRAGVLHGFFLSELSRICRNLRGN